MYLNSVYVKFGVLISCFYFRVAKVKTANDWFIKAAKEADLELDDDDELYPFRIPSHEINWYAL